MKVHKQGFVLGTLVLAALNAPALAQQSDHSAHHGGAQVAQAGAAWTEGEVRKVDKAANKITLKHGPIVNLDMPPMTMVFRVQDAALLGKVSAGDTVKFSVERIDGQITVTGIERTGK
jgi:Cu/Ag efflux protein CusF